jgi:hypothetical protein
LKRILLLLSACALVALAQDNKLPVVPQELLGKAVASPAPARKVEAQAAQPQAAVAPTVVSDGYELAVSADAPVTIAAGQFFVLPQSGLDFTGVKHARIAFQAVNAADMTGVHVAATWAAVGTYFNVTDISSGDGTLDLYTPTYGPILKVAFYNGTNAAIQLKQVSVYAPK